MKYTNLLAALSVVGTLNAAPFLEISEFVAPEYKSIQSRHELDKNEQLNNADISTAIAVSSKSEISEYKVTITNHRKKTILLRLRLGQEAGTAGGNFWDGLDYHSNVQTAISPKTDRYNFPVAVYLQNKKLTAVGFAPQTISSRFERHCEIINGKTFLYFDAFIALEPNESDVVTFLALTLNNADSYVEAVENIYTAYPEDFRPVTGADQRIYGVGGYFFSSDTNRDYQLEEARRFGLSWEWYYNCYQKAGDIFPNEELWDKTKGYKTEKSHAACDTPGSVSDWINYNKNRITAGNRSTAMFFYYLQQYCNSELLANVYKDSLWLNEKGTSQSKTHGWAEEGYAEYAWPGKTSSYGAALRKDLKEVWQLFDIAGFSLDCAEGHIPYYGPLASKEKGKAFDSDGKIFVIEGAAVAYNIDYTHALPAKEDGRKAASITNDPTTYLTAFHCDASMHEMPPFDRVETIIPRRLMLGQKPYYWWKGFRIDPLLRWQELSSSELNEGLSGIIDYTILMSLRFGAVPAVFFEHGFPDMTEWKDTFIMLQKLGWRAAPYAWVDGITGMEQPWLQEAPIWVSRFGDDKDSYIVLSIPAVKGLSGKLRIKTGKFHAPGAVYADISGNTTINTVTDAETVIDFNLKSHIPLILRKVADKQHGTLTAQIIKQPNGDSRIDIRDANKSLTNITEKAPLHLQPAPEAWIPSLQLKDGKKAAAIITAAPDDLRKIGHAVRNLEIYLEYFECRKKSPLSRLYAMDKFWDKSLRLPIFSLACPAEYKTVFALGENARKQLFPELDLTDTIVYREKDGKHLIAFFPGKQSEDKLIMAFLSELDKSYPFSGALSGEWAVKSKLNGKTFRKTTP